MYDEFIEVMHLLPQSFDVLDDPILLPGSSMVVAAYPPPELPTGIKSLLHLLPQQALFVLRAFRTDMQRVALTMRLKGGFNP